MDTNGRGFQTVTQKPNNPPRPDWGAVRRAGSVLDRNQVRSLLALLFRSAETMREADRELGEWLAWARVFRRERGRGFSLRAISEGVALQRQLQRHADRIDGLRKQMDQGTLGTALDEAAADEPDEKADEYEHGD